MVRGFFIGLVLLACEERPPVDKQRTPWCVGEHERKELIACVVRVTTAGNPQSDEEGEDLIKQAEDTCRAIACPERWVTCRVRRDGYDRLLANERCWYP